MCIVSFDLSTVACGYAVFENEELIESGTIKARKDHDKLGHRLSDLKTGLCNVLLLPISRDIDHIVSEQPLFFGKSNKPFSLGAIHGLLKMICYENELPEPEEIHNMTWKKHIAGTKATKEQTQDFLEKIRGIKTQTTDESDAVGVGLGWIAERNIPEILKTRAKRPLGTKRNKKVRKV